jgi:catechol 2,3-dioxygenase-like lactoylglutathione lyase family enzyme
MLNTEKAYPTVGVKDMAAARKFYEGPLGLREVANEGADFIAYRTNGSRLLVYKSAFAGTNEATAVTWIVADVEKAVNELKAHGVAFEHYDMPGMKLEGDVHVGGNVKVAWFKDPDGNIHSVAEE